MTRILTMSSTGAALLPQADANALVRPLGQMSSASVAKYVTVLTDEDKECPLLVVVEGVFTYPSFNTMARGGKSKRDLKFYQFSAGQERNWLRFYPPSESYSPFTDFEYRLNAPSVRAILAALKNDIVSYLRDLEEEQALLTELRQELDGVSRMITPKTQS